MSTPETGAALPSVESLTVLANELYQSVGAPGAMVPGATPPAPVAPPAPAVAPRVQPSPPPSSVGTAHPVPGVSGPVVDVPPVPLLPEQPAPVSATPSMVTPPAVPADPWAAALDTTGLVSDAGLPHAATPYAFPLVPQSLEAHSIAPASVRVHEPLPADSGVQAFHPGLVPDLPAAPAAFDPHVARRDFPILRTQVHGRDLIWLDNAATTQKPQAVIDRLVEFYEHENSNIHRAAHSLAARATDAYEGARESVRRFINAGSTEEIVFVRGTTEGINLVAKTWGAQNVGEGDEILITHLEHHANIVPWQQLCEATGAVLRVAPVNDDGDVIVEEFARLITPRTRLASVTHVSNALGTVTPVAELIGLAHAQGVPVLVDAAQSIAHTRVDVQSLDPDFLVMSGHKVYGPTGIGAVYAKRAILETMPPWEGGGNMISDVTFERTTFHGPPARFEAGTGNIADAVGMGAALDYLSRWGIDVVAAYEHSLMEYLVHELGTVPGLTMIGAPAHRAGAVSLILEGRDNAEVGQALDKEGIAVRSGHHCAQPILRRFGVESSVRPSLALYNTPEDVDALVAALHRIGSSTRA